MKVDAGGGWGVVEGVSKDGEALAAQVDADLVSAAGVKGAFY